MSIHYVLWPRFSPTRIVCPIFIPTRDSAMRLGLQHNSTVYTFSLLMFVEQLINTQCQINFPEEKGYLKVNKTNLS